MVNPSEDQVGPPDTISVGIIGDNRLVREAMGALLARARDIRVVSVAPSADLSELRHLHPGVVLLDLGGRSADSLSLARRVVEELPDSGLIVMDLFQVHEEVIEFVHSGVVGFIMRDASADDLVRTIRMVAGGGYVLPPQLTGALFTEIARNAVSDPTAIPPEGVRMTRREAQVIALISEGLSNKAIASRLHIAPHTVKSHVRNIMEKLAVHTRLQIAAYAHREPGEGPPEE